MTVNNQNNSTKKILRLPVKALYFYQIRDLEKPEEFRLANDYWRKRLENKTFDEVHITLGYPKAGDQDRTVIRPWRGFRRKWIKHEHFGEEAVDVFAIIVN